MPMHQPVSPARMPGRKRCFWSSVPNAISVGPIWRSANHEAAIGAPFSMRVSVTTNRSREVRPPPPWSTGHVIPIQPRPPSSRDSSRE